MLEAEGVIFDSRDRVDLRGLRWTFDLADTPLKESHDDSA
jgi:hypothetical protein